MGVTTDNTLPLIGAGNQGASPSGAASPVAFGQEDLRNTLGEVLGAEAGKAAVAVTAGEGGVELRLHRSTSATKDDGRLLRLTFLAKAPGVSPVRLQLVKHGSVEGPEGATEAKGVVRVR